MAGRIMSMKNSNDAVQIKIEMKIKFTLEQVTKAQRGKWKYSSTLSLTSALDRSWLSTPRPGRFTPGKEQVPTV